MCASCLDLSDDLYDQLASSPKSNLHWFCSKCEVVVLNTDAPSNSIIACIEQYLTTNLTKFEQEILTKVNASLNRKEENDLLQSIEGRLKKIEERHVSFEQSQLTASRANQQYTY